MNLHAKICLKIVFPNESQHTKNVWIFEFLKMEIHALFFPKNRKFLYVCMFSSTQTSYKFMDLSLNCMFPYEHGCLNDDEGFFFLKKKEKEKSMFLS